MPENQVVNTYRMKSARAYQKQKVIKFTAHKTPKTIFVIQFSSNDVINIHDV